MARAFKDSDVALRTAKRLQARSQHDHFPQHPQAIAEKTNFASLRMIPAHGNLPNSQAGTLREIKQLHIKREAIHASGFQDRTTNIETKGLEPALGVPKRQTGRDS